MSIEPRKVTGNDFLGKERRFREGRRIEKQTLQVLPQGKTWLKHTTGYQMNDALIFTSLCLPPNIFSAVFVFDKKRLSFEKLWKLQDSHAHQATKGMGGRGKCPWHLNYRLATAFPLAFFGFFNFPDRIIVFCGD